MFQRRNRGGETGRNFVLLVYVHLVGRKKNKEAAVFRIGIDTECEKKAALQEKQPGICTNPIPKTAGKKVLKYFIKDAQRVFYLIFICNGLENKTLEKSTSEKKELRNYGRSSPETAWGNVLYMADFSPLWGQRVEQSCTSRRGEISCDQNVKCLGR